MDIKPALLSAGEVARILRCSRSYVYKVARAGELGYVALGEDGPGRRTAMRFSPEAVTTFLKTRTVSPRSRAIRLSDCGQRKTDRGGTASGHPSR
jgi:excisionase family DNA binding protein